MQFYRDYDRALNTYIGSEGIGMDLTLVRADGALRATLRYQPALCRVPQCRGCGKLGSCSCGTEQVPDCTPC